MTAGELAQAYLDSHPETAHGVLTLVAPIQGDAEGRLVRATAAIEQWPLKAILADFAYYIFNANRDEP